MTNVAYQFAGGYGTVQINPKLIQSSRSPTTTDIISGEGNYYLIGQVWYNTNTQNYYVYNGDGVWNIIEGSTGNIEEIDTNSGFAVPVGGIINILGTGAATTSGAGNTVTIQVNPEAELWSVVAINTAMVADRGYFTNSAGTLNMTLPATAAIGDSFRIASIQGTYTVVQNAGQQVRLGNAISTTGSSGSVSSIKVGDALHLVCAQANVLFVQVDGPQGNFTIV